ncbi:MAG: PDZ domain-containing protein [Planctomycetes bacterium]|nr:PDZ domain-containing protein [Planctomycetota bacterium]
MSAEETSADASSECAIRGEFSIGKHGRMIVLPVELGGRTIECLVDTGAGLTGFDIGLEDELGSPEGFRMLQTPRGISRRPAYQWPDVTLSGQRFRTNRAVVGLDLEDVRLATNSRIQGVIGFDVLRQNRMQIDFDQGKLRFLDEFTPDIAASLGLRIPLELTEYAPPFVMGSAGKRHRLRFLIDTGTQGNSLDADKFDELLDMDEVTLGSEFESVTAAGHAKGERGYVESLSLGPFTLRKQRVARININSLGLRFLSRFVVTFDFPGRSLYLKKGRHFDRPEPDATSGLSLLWEHHEPVVQGVREGGPAARAGLRPQDVVVAVNGDEKLTRDPFALRQLLTNSPGTKVAMRVRRLSREFAVDLVLDPD